MLAAAVVALVFATVATLTGLSSRADAAHARCEEHLRRIRRQLEIPPTSNGRGNHPTPRGSR